MITYTFTFPALTCYPEYAEQTDVVYTVHWRLRGTDEDNYTAEVYGTVAVTYIAGEPYTPFNELTKEQVQGWVEAAMGEDQLNGYKLTIAKQIAEIIKPSSVNKPAPWE